MRGWDDSALVIPPANTSASTIPIHYVWRSFSIRDRLDREYGDHGNQVMWRFGRTGLLPPAAVQIEAFITMDAWLNKLAADTSNASVEKKVRRSKPAAAFDFCLLSTDVTQTTKVTDKATCDADPFLKPSSSPRQVAGGPVVGEHPQVPTQAAQCGRLRAGGVHVGAMDAPAGGLPRGRMQLEQTRCRPA